MQPNLFFVKLIEGLGGPKPGTPESDTLAKQCEEQAKSCLLCKGHSDIVAVFEPEEPKKFWARDDKTRFFIYGLCAPCSKKPTVNEDVEFTIKMSV